MCEVPVRCAKFIVRKQWIVAGTDDMHLRVYNYNTMEKVKAWEAHTDYIRYVEIHPNRPFIIRYVHTQCDFIISLQYYVHLNGFGDDKYYFDEDEHSVR